MSLELSSRNDNKDNGACYESIVKTQVETSKGVTKQGTMQCSDQKPCCPMPLVAPILPNSSHQYTLPKFPQLHHNGSKEQLRTSSTTYLPNGIQSHFSASNVHDIAKEALRLTKETLQSDSGSDNDHQTNSCPATPRVGSTKVSTPKKSSSSGSSRLNKFVRRLHDMLLSEKDSGIVEWRRGLLVLKNTDVFAKDVLPKYFNTRNFKTFRRQLNYYGFTHVSSFSNTGSSTTALWLNSELAQKDTGSSDDDDVSTVLLLRRVEPCENAKTAEGRRARKEQALATVEDDLGVSAKSLQIQQIRSMASGTVFKLEHHHHQPPSNLHCGPMKPRTDSIQSTDTTGTEETNASEKPSPKPPSSSTSAANLLLLLSRA